MFFSEVVPLFWSRKGQVSGYRRANDLHKDRVLSNLSEWSRFRRLTRCDDMHLSGFISLVVRKRALYLFLVAMGSVKLKSLYLCSSHKDNDLSLLNETALNINILHWFECQSVTLKCTHHTKNLIDSFQWKRFFPGYLFGCCRKLQLMNKIYIYTFRGIRQLLYIYYILYTDQA